MKWIIGILVAAMLGLCLAAGVWYARRSDSATTFRTATVTRGDLAVNITATGTVEPEEVVDVGAQVAGKIIDFGNDKAGKPIDYGSEVVKDQVIAHIDDTLYQADYAQAQAQLEANKAAVDRAVADLGQLKAKLTQAERDWQRTQKLGPSDALSQVDYDSYESAYEVAKANVAVGDAAIKQAQGTVTQTEASMIRAKQNLAYCTIVSPVDGTVIDRRVNVGQTVVSSLNAPSLFLLGKDMKRMNVLVQVNEADIGSIQAGQPVAFTVDTFPNITFHGTVNKVRLSATFTQNVVTYTVEVVVDNSAGKLMPYLTANVAFQISKHENVLMVPNAALRWSPKTEQIAPDVRDAEASSTSTQPAGNSERRGRSGSGGANNANGGPTSRPSRGELARGESSDGGAAHHGTLWVEDGEFVRPIHVRLGATDGIFTEIVGDQVQENQAVVIGEMRDDGSASAGTSGAGGNPFLPQMPRRGGRR